MRALRLGVLSLLKMLPLAPLLGSCPLYGSTSNVGGGKSSICTGTGRMDVFGQLGQVFVIICYGTQVKRESELHNRSNMH